MDTTIFSTLFKHCSGSDENFLTDSFVYVLKLLLVRSSDEGLTFINRLCGLMPEAGFEQAAAVTISTQVTVDEGRPDIEIKDHRILAYIEVKHDGALAQGQLEYYHQKLRESKYEQTHLVLLTRSRTSALETTLEASEYCHTRWYQVHAWLRGLPVRDEVCLFFIQNFLDFLVEKNMTMNKVTWEYMQGVPALVNFTNMLEEAIAEVMPTTKIRRTAGWSWRGFYTNDGFYIGVRLNLPMVLAYEDNFGNYPMTYKRDLDLEETHFFALKQGEQFECLINFLRDARTAAPQTKKNVNLDEVVQEDTVQE